MFFRRKVKKQTPKLDEDGYYYAEDGDVYDSDEFETDSDDDDDYDDDDDEADSKSEKESHDEIVEVHANKKGGDEASAQIQDPNPTNDGEDEAAEKTSAAGVIGKATNERKELEEEELVKWPSSSDDSYEHVQSPVQSPARNAAEIPKVHVDVKGGQLELEIDHEEEARSELSASTELESVNLNDESPQKMSHPKTETEESLSIPSSLDDNRSLLALAAEHDRVDVLKAILQPNITGESTGSGLVQLMLNNVLVEGNDEFSENDLEQIFLPPLHIAIASSSANAASCFLRMGSNPALRPDIPEGWIGPGWKDEKGEDIFTVDKWEILKGKSAWELAFGPSKMTPSDASEKEEKRGWFGFASTKSQDKKVSSAYTRVEIEPTKLEGIKHAFTAEALRSIGSDEVDRLAQLLNSGFSSNDRIEIGGKDLFKWCQEMNASKCIELLKSKRIIAVPTVSNESDNEALKKNGTGTHQEQSVSEPANATKIEEDVDENANANTNANDDEDDGLTYDASTLLSLWNACKENESLVAELSSTLDNLAEEVSVSQGLLMEHGDPTNNALLSQVRTLKQKRGEIEDETSLWEYKLSDRSAELNMVMIWWQKRGGVASDIQPAVDHHSSVGNESSGLEKMTSQELKSAVKEAHKQVDGSEKKIEKLRTSIKDLSDESNRNMERVEELGLSGAIRLTRKLKQEVNERREELHRVIRKEADMAAKVYKIREMLEKDEIVTHSGKSNENETAQSSRSENPPSLPPKKQPVEEEYTSATEDLIESIQPETPLLELMNENQVPQNLHDEDSYDGEDENDDSYDSCDSEEDYDSYESSSDESLTHSDAIKQGKSKAIMSWKEDDDLGIFAFKMWDLLTRIFGLSKKAIKQTARSTVEEITNPHVMII